MNVLIPLTLLTGVMTCLWPFVRSTSGLIVVVAIYGWSLFLRILHSTWECWHLLFNRLSSGSYGSLVSVPVIEIGELGDTHQDLGQRIGILMTFLASGSLLGPPISGLIFRGLGIEAMGIYAGAPVLNQLEWEPIHPATGCMIMFGVSMMCIPRYLVLDARGKARRTPIG